MKKLFLFVLVLLTLSVQAQFSKYFYNKTLRMDYYHSGNDTSEYYTFDELIEEPYWGGSHVNLVDTMNYGNYYVKVYNLKNDSLLYSRGYSTLFREWQTTDEAKKISRTFSETVVIPYPKENVRIELYSRDWNGKFHKKFSYVVDTNDYFIKHDRRLVYPDFNVRITGDPAHRVDVVILPEGYTEAEMGKFINDCKNFVNSFFTFAPYTQNKDKFNFRAVLAPSRQSGTDIPAKGIWKSTILNTSYYTFNSERYLMTMDDKSVRDLAANAPYDQIYILVNSKKYGGGAIFNYYNVAVNSNVKSAKIIIHEFGHGFAGLADEYYNDPTAYGKFYNLNIEPWEPNITTLHHFDKKWKDMVKPGTPIPTPATKKYRNTVGAFEGGGYEPKGMYRPMQDCLMKSFKGNKFCPVCQRAIQRMIDFYTK
ncbi:IgA Peptidase M64 [Candidatus Sulfidibacterium hydrothermale]|uniref:M64 family metallopeptidase n=1 Tax=Candidatus Sulfidibacterium hydrothermale TaxID=2875962 RepID=UPI001F0A9534|nr:M64 family metallopeptidase [Candidatus Sulfidibacterium hydrothermale]UBM62588.1 IgA Peptidase M64 [Candidatus Sulfidibacterium hydrothermale]